MRSTTPTSDEAGNSHNIPLSCSQMGSAFLRIAKRQGDGAHQALHVRDIQRLIREAGKALVERDRVYRPVKRDPATDRVIRGEAVLLRG